MSNYYFDDPEEGPAFETSHPRFRELATEEFYVDCIDDFGPFGSDDGADTLAQLEDWYREGGENEQIQDFLDELLIGWGFNVPAFLFRGTPEEREAWLAQEQMHETYLQSECRARVATAVGQLKISGSIHAPVRDEALEALNCQLWLNERARVKSPEWPYADEERTKLENIQSLLNKL